MVQKKKWSRTVVGSILKSKNPTEPDYFKIENDVTLKKGQVLKLESQKFQLAEIEKGKAAGRLNEETYSFLKEKIEKIPSFVRFRVISVTAE